MVEIIPKPVEKKAAFEDIILYFSIFLLILVLIASLIFFLLEKRSKTTLETLKNQLTQTRTSEIIQLEKEILNYQKKIKDFSQILNQHQFSSKFFQFLEKNSHPNVFFSKIDLDTKNSKVILSGQIDSFSNLGQQISIFGKEPQIKDQNLSGITITKEGKIEFSLTLGLKPEVFK